MNPEARKYLAGIGRKGGKVKSDAKAEAARANAKLGGWPKGKPRKPKRAARRHNDGVSDPRRA